MINEKFEERLRELELREGRILALLDNLTGKLESGLTALGQSQSKVELTLYGDGGEKAGIIVRMDRLEQAQERAVWLWRAGAGAIVTLLAAAAWNLLR